MEVRRDVILRTAGIFERVASKKIYVTFTNHGVPAASQYSSRSYLISFPQKTDDKYWYRTFEHELSHIVFNSSFRKIELFVSKFPTPSLAHFVLNLVEDVRVDSLWNEIYKGSAEIRRKQLEQHYRALVANIKKLDVIEVLSFAYLKANGLDIQVPKEVEKIVDEITQEVVKVKKKSADASFPIATRVMEIIYSWKGRPMGQTPKSEPLKKALEKIKREFTNNQEIQSEEERARQILEWEQDHKSNSKTKSDEIEIQKLLEKPIIEIEKVSEVRGVKEVEEVKKKLEEIKSLERVDPKEKTYGKVGPISAWSTGLIKVEPKPVVARRLARYFTKLRLKYKARLAEEGDEIDVDSYINHLHESEKPVFLSEEVSMGSYVGILVDFSSSMDGRRAMKSIEACLTIQEAVKSIPEIKVEFFPFYSDRNHDLCIAKIKDARDLTKIPPQGYTPTNLAVYWAGQEVLRKPQTKKFLIIITDGKPEDNRHSPSVLASWTRNVIQMLRRKGVHVFTLFIEPYNIFPLSRIFGPEHTWIAVHDEEIDEKIVEFFRLVVEGIIKR